MRVVSQSPLGSAGEDAQNSRRSGSPRDTPSLPAYKSPTRSSLLPGCGTLRPQLHAQPEPCAEEEVARLAPAQNSGKNREKVSERAGQLPRVWKLEWSRIWVRGGVQFNANFSRPSSMSGPSGSDHHLYQVQQLQNEERAVGWQVGSCVEEALWGPAALRDTAERRRPPSPEGQALVALRPRSARSCSRGGGCRRRTLNCDVVSLLSTTNDTPTRSGANQAIKDLMATQIHTCSSQGRQCRRRVLLCQSQP